MLESEANISNKELRREKIRERYKGSNSELLEVIPGKKAADFYDDVERRVAVYVRVSTDNLQQTSSYELQKNYYEEKVSKNPNWTLVGIYDDEGISGTSLLHREAFNRMIEDCKAGKIDMIITKSVSRFARNIVDCISIVRQLSSLKNPVGVRFETEGIFTLNDNTEMSLSFTATIAQEESHIKSSIMNSSIEMRFGRGIVLTPVLLGYDHDEDGKLTINEKEAKTVRLIFFMYLYGYSCKDIVAIMYTQLFNLLCDKADDKYGGRLPVHVRFILDEFANIGQIPKFDKLIATIRSREISASIILQAQSQLKAIYKDNADTIVGNCDTTLFLGGKEKTTLKEISEILGKETIDLYNTGESRGKETSHSLNYQKTGKELMSMDELSVMDGSKCILQLRGVRPFLSNKYDLTKHPKFALTSDADDRNLFDVEKYLSHKLTVKPNTVVEVYDCSESNEDDT